MKQPDIYKLVLLKSILIYCAVFSGMACSKPANTKNTAAPLYAYISIGSDGLYQCSIAENGQLSSCKQTIYKSNANSAALYTIWDQFQFVYIAGDFDGLTQCKLNPDGSLSECQKTPAKNTPDWKPSGITFASVSGNDYGYVSDLNGHVYQCSYPYNDGLFASCTNAVSSGEPSWGAVNKISFAMIEDTQYAYVSADAGVFQCALNKDGSFHQCKNALAGKAPRWSPAGITFAQVNGGKIAYVTSVAFAPGMGIPGLFHCNVTKDGTLDKCSSVAGYPEVDSNSSELVIVDGKGSQSALIASTSNMYLCTINPDGNFSACAITPTQAPKNWTPYGVVTKALQDSSK